jgi:release factor glutamine methyltransferase
MNDAFRSPPRGVYPPREDSLLLLPFATAARGRSVLEVGCGAGEASLAAARAGARVVATDRNRAALEWVRDRAAEERLRVDVVRTDLARGLGRFDVVLANPPYLPTPGAMPGEDAGDRLALDGGPDGARVTARLVADLSDHLTATGCAYVLVSSLQSPEAIADVLRGWNDGGGRSRSVVERSQAGERLEVLELRRADAPA